MCTVAKKQIDFSFSFDTKQLDEEIIIFRKRINKIICKDKKVPNTVTYHEFLDSLKNINHENLKNDNNRTSY